VTGEYAVPAAVIAAEHLSAAAAVGYGATCSAVGRGWHAIRSAVGPRLERAADRAAAEVAVAWSHVTARLGEALLPLREGAARLAESEALQKLAESAAAALSALRWLASVAEGAPLLAAAGCGGGGLLLLRWRLRRRAPWLLQSVAAAGEGGGEGARHFSMVRADGAVLPLPGPLQPDLPLALPSLAAGARPHAEARCRWLAQVVQYRPTDVVLASYPYCGAALVERLAVLLLGGGAGRGGAAALWPEESLSQHGEGRVTLSEFESLAPPRLLTSRAPLRCLLSRQRDGAPAAARYVVVTRNPLDACSACYRRGWDPRARGWPFDAHALAWLDGRAGGSFGATGSFCDFYRGWRGAALRYPPAGRHATRMEALLLQAPGSSWWRENGSDAVGVGDGAERPMVLWLHLEALLREPGREAARLAAFLGLDGSDGRLIDSVVSDATFGALREAELQALGGWREDFAPHPGLRGRVEAALKRETRGLGLRYDLGGGEDLQ